MLKNAVSTGSSIDWIRISELLNWGIDPVSGTDEL